jgi:hypothetical protein
MGFPTFPPPTLLDGTDYAPTAFSSCDEGPIKVIRGTVREQFADFQNPFLEAEIASVL